MTSRPKSVSPNHPQPAERSQLLKWLAIAAVAFGLVTVVSGSRALFGSPEMRTTVGHAVPFVLWFNFLSGFVYILAGAGLLLRRTWAVYAALFVAASTLLVFGAFGVHVLGGGAYELRTVGAMTLRSLFWIAVATVAFRKLPPPTDTRAGSLNDPPRRFDHKLGRNDIIKPTEIPGAATRLSGTTQVLPISNTPQIF